MTPEQIAEARQLCDAATPGPWAWDTQDEDDYPCILYAYPTNPDVRDCHGTLRPYMAWPIVLQSDEDEPHITIEDDDARFVAHARTVLPRLLDEVDRLRKALELIRDMGHDPEAWPVPEPAEFYRAGMVAMVHAANRALGVAT